VGNDLVDDRQRRRCAGRDEDKHVEQKNYTQDLHEWQFEIQALFVFFKNSHALKIGRHPRLKTTNEKRAPTETGRTEER
jgi:hypothetical protein